MKDITLFKKENSIFLKVITKKNDLKKNDNFDGYLIKADEKIARSIIESIKQRDKTKIIALQAGDDLFNRRAIETLKINYLVNVEVDPKRDTLKQRDSGINHIVAKEAAIKKIVFVINMSKIESLIEKKQAKVLARIIQNIKICRKARAQIKLASFAKDKKDLCDEKGVNSFLTTLGMSSQEIKKARIF
jgi:ribonuclease P/MRP protein subunit RPP1